MKADNVTIIGLCVFYAVYLILICLGIAGWIMNVFAFVKLLQANSPINPEWIARLVGIPFGPLGAVLGLFW